MKTANTKQIFDVEKFELDKKIDQNRISDAMSDNADILGFYGNQQTLWQGYSDLLKLQIANKSAQLELEIRRIADAEGQKVTDSSVKAQVAADEDILKLQQTLIKSQEQYRLYLNAVDAVEHKGKMLISLGAWLRSEMDNLGMHINHSDPTKMRKFPEAKERKLRETGAA